MKMRIEYELIFVYFASQIHVLFSSVDIHPKSVFPVELGESVTWSITTKGGDEFNTKSIVSFEISNEKSFRINNGNCAGPAEQYFSCTHKSGNNILVTFTPPEVFYGGDLVIKYFKDMDSVWKGVGTTLFREAIQLTKQPTFIEMTMRLKEPSRFTSIIPTGLRLDPPVFLTGSIVRIECSTDGSLPPVPVTFSVECPPPSTAVVEHDRITQAKRNMPYELFYRTYGFRSPPTLSDLAPYVARKHASEILQGGHVSSKDNKTLWAVLTLTQKAHDCHVVCRIAGKETRRRLTVFHPTTVSYLLPHPRNGYINVGTEVTCYADGHPPPMISLRLSQPLRPPKPLSEEELETLRQIGRLPKLNGEDAITRELLLENSGLEIIPQQLGGHSTDSTVPGTEDQPFASSGTLHQVPEASRNRWLFGDQREPYEDSKRIPGIGLSTVERYRQLGLHPNEYSIQGATFRLAPNATPGVELLLTCTARNVLPGDTTFLGLNGTITRSRFVVSAISYTSLGVSIGVCACILLILLIVILAMFLQRRRQLRSGSDTERLAPNGMKKAKVPPKTNYTKGAIAPSRPQPGSALNSVHRPHSAAHAIQPCVSAEAPGPSHTLNYSHYDPIQTYPDAQFTHPVAAAPTDAELQYVELAFDRNPPTTQRTMLRGGPTSASMTLVGSTPKANYPASSYGASVPHSLNTADGWPTARPPIEDPSASHYTEIVAVMQPKAHSSQLVLQQQQEATQALLAMQQNKPRVFV